MRKQMIWVFMFVGSLVGGYVPVLWGGSFFSFSSVILTAVGGFGGIWLAVKIFRD